MESQKILNPEQDKNTQEHAQEQVQEQTSNPSSEKDWFNIVYSSTLGFSWAIGQIMFVMITSFIFLILMKVCINRWICTDYFIEVGENGYCYDPIYKCLVKPMPNRRIIKGCMDIEYNPGDTIGVVQVGENEYRYVNFNTLSFINDKKYFRADVFRDGTAIAIANDTIYHISTTGKTVSTEPSERVYGSVEEITVSQEVTDSDGYPFTIEVQTGLFKYGDINGNYGLMTHEFVPLTKPLYSDITAISKGVFFCEYLESGLGVLVDNEGHVIKDGGYNYDTFK